MQRSGLIYSQSEIWFLNSDRWHSFHPLTTPTSTMNRGEEKIRQSAGGFRSRLRYLGYLGTNGGGCSTELIFNVGLSPRNKCDLVDTNWPGPVGWWSLSSVFPHHRQIVTQMLQAKTWKCLFVSVSNISLELLFSSLGIHNHNSTRRKCSLRISDIINVLHTVGPSPKFLSWVQRCNEI